jgi:hypothetical protein
LCSKHIDIDDFYDILGIHRLMILSAETAAVEPITASLALSMLFI